MAYYIKNDVNFHGARSKTRVVENRSENQDSHSKNSTKNNGSHDDGWGSIPNSSRNNNNSNWDGGWGEVPKNTSPQEDTWGQDRLVSGKAERNRKFRNKENSTFRVPIQSLPNWDEVDNEFPALGSRRAPVPNVWEKRKQEFEEKKSIEPTSQSEEEMMIQQALELSKMETRQEEERRRQLEEEYRLQTQLLEANPDMFDEFRLGGDEFAATAGGLAAQSSKTFNDYSEEFPSNEIVDNQDDWDYSSQKTTKEKEPKKGKKKTEYPSREEGLPKLKHNSGLPPFNTRVELPSDESVDCEDNWDSTKKFTKEKELKKGRQESEYSNGEEGLPQLKQSSGLPPFKSNAKTNPKIPKVVEMFGGWGNVKPFTQDVVETKSFSTSNKWETVDTNFVSRSSKTSAIEEKPACQPSTPSVLEVKLENTTNWDAIDNIDLKSDSAMPEKRNYLGTRDTVELNLKDCEPGYSLDQKEQEFAIQSKKKNSKPKVDMHTEVKGSTSISEEQGNEIDACFEQERNSNWNESYDEIALKTGKHGNLLSNSKQFQSISAEKNVGAKIEERNASAKIEVGSLEEKCSDSQKSVENDYDFLLSHIDNTYTGAQVKELSQNHAIPVEKKSDIPSKNSQPEISEEANPTASSFSFDNFLSELGSTISEPKPIKNDIHSSSNPQLDLANSGQYNTNEINPLYSEPDYHLPMKMPHTGLNATSLPTFGGYPTNAEGHNLPGGNDNASHIEPPKGPVPTPEFINPAFLPQPSPMMTPLMNPALMMGMNPMMMQQMMMFSNPFFVQQLQQMDMYYKSLGMPLATGMPFVPQPMPMPTFHNPNLQGFSNSMNSGSGPNAENGTIPPLIQTPVSQLPGPEARHLDRVPPKVEQSDTDSFWFQDYMSSEASPSFIPPPKPTPMDAPTNPNVLPEASAASMSRNTSQEGLLDNGNASDLPSYDSSSRAEVPYATGWGDIDEGSKSNNAPGWNDDANGWGSENAMIAKSMRNSSRYVPENKGSCRQPASRPYLGRPKT